MTPSLCPTGKEGKLRYYVFREGIEPKFESKSKDKKLSLKIKNFNYHNELLELRNKGFVKIENFLNHDECKSLINKRKSKNHFIYSAAFFFLLLSSF